MGIPLLQKTINKLGYMQKVNYVYNHKHIIIDMNNQIYKLLHLQRKTLTPTKKFQLIQQYCQKLINISQQRGIKFYIVLDQMICFSQQFEYNFEKEYAFLKPYTVKISNGFLQVYKQEGMQNESDQDEQNAQNEQTNQNEQTYQNEQSAYNTQFAYKNLHAINMISKINYIKPQLEKKVIKNKKDAAELKQEILNGGAVKNDNFSFLLASKYNYYLYETMFDGIPNIEIHVANTEADFKIAQIAKRLIDSGIPVSDICIHSQDSDLLILQTNVDIQQNILLLSRQRDISQKLKYYYFYSSDYVQRFDNPKTIMQELNKPTTEEERKAILLKACENRELNLLMADILFQHFDVLEGEQQYIPVQKENIKGIQHIKLVFEIYEQFQFNTYFQNIQHFKTRIQQNPYFQDVMQDTWVNTKLSEKETILKMYFQNAIPYDILIERLKQIEQDDLNRKQFVSIEQMFQNNFAQNGFAQSNVVQNNLNVQNNFTQNTFTQNNFTPNNNIDQKKISSENNFINGTNQTNDLNEMNQTDEMNDLNDTNEPNETDNEEEL